MRLLVLCVLLLSWSVVVFAGGGSSPFSKGKLEQLPKISRQDVYSAKDLFLYHGLVYRLNMTGPNASLPKSHKKILNRIKQNKNSEITDEDVQFHNEELRKFISAFENVVGILEE